jgi:hypothetical protein
MLQDGLGVGSWLPIGHNNALSGFSVPTPPHPPVVLNNQEFIVPYKREVWIKLWNSPSVTYRIFRNTRHTHVLEGKFLEGYFVAYIPNTVHTGAYWTKY